MPLSALQLSFEQWVRKACENHKTGATDPIAVSLAIAGLNELVQKKLSYVALAANKKASLAALPAHILHCILLDLDVEATVALSRSCHRLRQLALQTPEAWSSLRFTKPTRSFNRERALIGRSRTTPLKLSLGTLRDTSATLTWTTKLCQTLTESIPRMKSLALSMEAMVSLAETLRLGQAPSFILDVVQVSQWSPILHALAMPAPILSQLRLSGTDMITHEPFYLSADLFAGDAPALTTCLLWGVTLPSVGCPAFSNLTTLHHHAGQFSMCAPAITLAFLAKLLDALPRLVTLCLEGQRLSSPSLPSSGQIVSANRSLRNVLLHHLARSSFNQVHAFLKDLGVRNFSYNLKPSWTDQPTDPNSTLEQLAEHCPRVTSATLDVWYAELVDESEDGQASPLCLRLRLRDSSCIFNGSVDLAHLTHLTIGEFCLPRGTQLLPELPRLTTLCVVLASCSQHRLAGRYGAEPGIFVSSERGWSCPSLLNVQFAHRLLPITAETCMQIAYTMGHPLTDVRWSDCCCNVALTISLREVYHFLISSLEYERVRLEQLKLTGVEPIDADIGSMMERLYELADEVIISSVAETVAFQDPVDCSSCIKSFL